MRVTLYTILGVLIGVGATVGVVLSDSPSEIEDNSFSVGDHVFVLVPASAGVQRTSAYKWGFRTGVACTVHQSQPAIDAHPWIEPDKTWWDAGFEDGSRVARNLNVDRHEATEELLDSFNHVLMLLRALEQTRNQIAVQDRPGSPLVDGTLLQIDTDIAELESVLTRIQREIASRGEQDGDDQSPTRSEVDE